MTGRLRSFIIPTYLMLCLLIGGSAQGNWRNMVLQLLAVLLIAWAAVSRQAGPASRASRALLILAAAAFIVFVLQLIPLPPELWQRLSGRSLISAGVELLPGGNRWLTVSLAPYDTLKTSLALLPPLAILLGITRLGAYEDRWLAAAILVGMFLNVLLGAVQVAGGGWPHAWWFLYEFTNPGAVGFFANRNHTGTLLLASIPFSALLFASHRDRNRALIHGRRILGAAGLVLVFVGLGLNHSLAALVLVIPVVFASAFLLPRNWPRLAVAFGIVFVLASVVILAASIASVRSELLGSDLTSFAIRGEIWSATLRAIEETFPIGTGFGTFSDAYGLVENASIVGATYINHAHNDYLELTLEAGLPGVLLMLAFVAWWLWSATAIWKSRITSTFARAATIASGAILGHSFVDYPLRTMAIAAIFATCVAVMARSVGPHARQGDRDAPRHYIIG